MDEEYYLRIWLSSLKKFDISLSESALLTLVMNLSTKKGYCYAGKRTLGKILGLSSVTIHAKINRLKAKGLLEVVEPTINVASSCLKVSDTWKNYIDDLTESARMNQWESFKDVPF
jgi:hypothetical protein